MDALAFPAKALDPVAKAITALWRRFRFGPRVELSLSWDHPPVVFLDGRNTSWRSLKITFTTAKHEEYVLASGIIEAKSLVEPRWIVLVSLEELLALPITLPANREWADTIPGSAIASRLRERFGSGAVAWIRLVTYDLHKCRVRSSSMETTTLDFDARRTF